jgi:methyl-accepting chemotaxis protein
MAFVVAVLSRARAATREIAHNVNRAAMSTQNVSSTIGSVTEAARQAGVASAQVSISADSVSAELQPPAAGGR